MNCSRRPCEPLGCSHPLTPSGHCCPTCQGTPALPLPSQLPASLRLRVPWSGHCHPSPETATQQAHRLGFPGVPHPILAPSSPSLLSPCANCEGHHTTTPVLPDLPALQLSPCLPKISRHQTPSHSVASTALESRTLPTTFGPLPSPVASREATLPSPAHLSPSFPVCPSLSSSSHEGLCSVIPPSVPPAALRTCKSHHRGLAEVFPPAPHLPSHHLSF